MGCCPLAEGMAAHRWLTVPSGSERGRRTLPSLVWIIPLRSPGLLGRLEDWHSWFDPKAKNKTYPFHLFANQTDLCLRLSNSSVHGTAGYTRLRTIHSNFISVFVWRRNRQEESSSWIFDVLLKTNTYSSQTPANRVLHYSPPKPTKCCRQEMKLPRSWEKREHKQSSGTGLEETLSSSFYSLKGIFKVFFNEQRKIRTIKLWLSCVETRQGKHQESVSCRMLLPSRQFSQVFIQKKARAQIFSSQ